MSKLALYRKYRSTDLKELVGQEHVTKTIEASLEKGNISHAYLFSGPRGVGKTSTARILARRVNKIPKNKKLNEFLDIIEIDAASNRGIDDVRSLREKLSSAPAQLDYKVIIIDEVHMLTREAFNALLKTLEEPPSHVLFILATTEHHKLPKTIISRTQHYEFRPFTVEQIVNHLKNICSDEGIDAQDSGLEAIAFLAGGSMRDAIGILDQLSSLSTQLDETMVQKLIGQSSSSQLDKIYQELISGDKKASLDKAESAIKDGVEPFMLCDQLQSLFRNKLVNSEDKINDNDYIYAIDKFFEASERFKYTPVKNLPLEIAIVKIANKFYHADSSNVINKSQSKKINSNVSQKEKESNINNLQQKKVELERTPNKNATNIKSTNISCVKGLSIIKEHNNSLYSLLNSGNARITNNQLIVDCRFNFHKQRIEEPRNREFIEKVMSKVCNTPIRLKCNIISTKDKAIDVTHEVVSSAMAILGGELVDG